MIVLTFVLSFSFRAPGRETWNKACLTIFSLVFFWGAFDFYLGIISFICFLLEPTGLDSLALDLLGVIILPWPGTALFDLIGTSSISFSSSSYCISLLSSIPYSADYYPFWFNDCGTWAGVSSSDAKVSTSWILSAGASLLGFEVRWWASLGDTFMFAEFLGESFYLSTLERRGCMFFSFAKLGSLFPYFGIWTFSTGSCSSSILSFSACLFYCLAIYFCLNSSNFFNFSPLSVSESKPISIATAYYFSSISLSSLLLFTKSWISSIFYFCSSRLYLPPKLSPLPH